MEICVNDYIRTDKGYIRKIDKIDECKYCGQNVYIYKETIGDLHFEHTYHKGDLTKHSKNIIDLIQCGDYVNGMRVIATENRGRYNEEKQKDEKVILAENYDEWTENGVISNEDIKTILTHEQYEQNSFKL